MQRSPSPPPADDSLFHVSQRLDALAADDEHAFLYFSRVLTPPYPDASATLPSGSSASAPPPHERARASTITTRLRRRRQHWLVRAVGLSAFYARFASLVGLGWFIAAYAVLSAALVMPRAPQRLMSVSIDATVTLHRQMGRELAAFSIGAALGGLSFGSLADHYGRRRVLLSATACAGAAQIASGFAWAHAPLLVGRGLEGLGLGGQLVLFHIVLCEFTAQRRRGRIAAFGMAFAALGAMAAVHSAHRLEQALDWKLFTSAVLGGSQAVYFIVLLCWLHDTPRFLAAVGRVEFAMLLVEAIESAHGINRNARVTMPSSLYEPPAQHRRESSFHRSARATRVSRASRGPSYGQRELSHHSHRSATATPPGPRRRRTSLALTPGIVSVWVSLGKRWKRVLVCRPYARRSLGLGLLWLVVSGGLSVAVASAARFGSTADDTTLLMTCVGAAAFVGLVLTATIIDASSRVHMVLVGLLVSSLAVTMIGMQLFLSLHGHLFVTLGCSLLALAGSVALSTASVWTLEQYGVLIRATGTGLAFSGSCIGLAGGQWITWSSLITGRNVSFVLWGIAAAFILASLLTWLWGYETRGVEDVDSVETVEVAAVATPVPSYERDSSEKHPPHAQLRGTYHSKEKTADDLVTEATDENDPAFTAPSSSSAASTFVGSSLSRMSSGVRHSSVRFSSQRTLSSGGSRGTRGSSLSRQPTAGYRRREGSRSSQQRSLSARGESAYAMRRSSTHSDQVGSGVMRSSLARRAPPEQQRRGSRAERLGSSFSSNRLMFSELTTTLPARLDPHSVREHLGRHSSEDESSSDGLGEHDVLTIEIDPFDSGGFAPLPILGD